MTKEFQVYVDGNPVGEFDDFDVAFNAMHDGAKAGGKGEIMTNMVDSASDERTINNAARHEYRVLTADEKSAMIAVKDAGLALIKAIEALPPCRESSLGVTKAEEAVMWAIKGLTK